LERTGKQGRQWAVSLFVVAFVMGIVYVIWLSSGSGSDEVSSSTGQTEAPNTARPTRTPKPTHTPRPTKTPRPSPTPTPAPLRVGVVAGHWQNDSGAVCADGLEEVSINLDVAKRVVAVLEDQGYRAELLPEFSDDLTGYQAEAFVSIHTDSCEVPGLSGFKVARVVSSAIPDREDRLVACLVEEYASATGLEFNESTITYDMTDYHAFWEIDPNTPGAIIELGFMDEDRNLLTRHPDQAARGVANGILCFLQSQ
jgi:N-acetylmuramoyl-L-alanine amidase